MKYFKFSQPKKKLGVNKKETIISKILNFAFSFIPKANPKYDKLIQFVDVWYIEYDDVNECIEKEIGLNENYQVILKMPFQNEYGYWLDTDMKFEDFQNRFGIEKIDEPEFFKKWNELE
ncbi:hypothetical protein [Flavobacterium humi]|uniref:Uncharacterized protein n=1 Tax=Flavobacterium humi TaxID=2562683 RepID=A0A4Z0LBW5_9FLAO|nr:hypothetical protein [Flavobacterium humi]TGD59381.1 hypothetical protein E4635_00135 [Flavobacterium humi]